MEYVPQFCHTVYTPFILQINGQRHVQCVLRTFRNDASSAYQLTLVRRSNRLQCNKLHVATSMAERFSCMYRRCYTTTALGSCRPTLMTLMHFFSQLIRLCKSEPSSMRDPIAQLRLRNIHEATLSDLSFSESILTKPHQIPNQQCHPSI